MKNLFEMGLRIHSAAQILLDFGSEGSKTVKKNHESMKEALQSFRKAVQTLENCRSKLQEQHDGLVFRQSKGKKEKEEERNSWNYRRGQVTG